MANKVTFEFILRNAAFKRASREVTRLNNKMTDSMKRLRRVSSSAGGALRNAFASRLGAAAVGAGLVASVKTFGNLEDAITTTLTLVDSDKWDSGRKKLEKMAREAIKLGFSTEDVGAAMFDTVSFLGLNEKGMETFQAAQKLAIGGNTTLKDSVFGISSVLSAFADENVKATDAMNFFFTAQKFGATDVTKLTANLGKAFGTAKLAGASYKELGAITAELTKSIPSTEQTVTSLDAAINTLLAPTTEVEELFASINAAKLGFKIPVGPEELKEVGLIEAFKSLAALGKLDKKLLLKVVPERRAARAIGNLDERAFKAIDNTMAQFQIDIDTGTGAMEAFGLKMDTLNRDIAVTAGHFKILASDVGDFIQRTGRSGSENVVFPVFEDIVAPIASGLQQKKKALLDLIDPFSSSIEKSPTKAGGKSELELTIKTDRGMSAEVTKKTGTLNTGVNNAPASN